MGDIVNTGGVTKEVRFDIYCKTCKHETLSEDEYPCRDCLSYPFNEYSHKPYLWEKKDKEEKRHGNES